MNSSAIECTTDIALFRKSPFGLQVLLIKRGGPIEADKWAMPGGHVDPEDHFNIEEGAVRELREETGVEANQSPYPIHLRYIGNRRDGNWIGHTFWGVVGLHHSLLGSKAGDDAAASEWFTRYRFEQLPMAFDHREVVEYLFDLAEQILPH